MHERIAKLIERLYEKTKASVLTWERNPDGDFQTSFPSYTVELSRDQDFNTRLYIYNEEGDIIDSVSDVSLDRSALQGSKLAELYTMARRIALGSDQAIEDLIAALED